MTSIATRTQSSVAGPSTGGRRLRISPRIRNAVELLISGRARTQVEAAALAKLDRSHLCRELKRPHIRAFYEERVRQTIGQAQIPATATLIRLLNGKSEHVQLDAADRILQLNGYANANGAPGVVINVNAVPGFVINSETPTDVRRWIEEQTAQQSGPGYLIRLDAASDPFDEAVEVAP